MSIPAELTRAWVDVDLAALVANARAVIAACGSRLLPMIKANGYGLGATQVARALERVDAWGFGVATAQEGIELRRAGIRQPLVVFTPFTPDAADTFLEHELRPTIGDNDSLEAWLARGERPFHVEVDTGMSRAGYRYAEAPAWRDRVAGAPGWEGIFTHFHSAEHDPPSVQEQWSRFCEVVGALPRRPSLVHAANSAAALQGRRYAADLVRPGIFLYGGEAWGAAPRPVARLRARVVALRTLEAGDSASYGAAWRAARPTRVATVAVGYADGVPRMLGNRAHVELCGERVPILGRVTMDMLMVEAPPACRIGDVATIFGGLVSLDEQARHAETISYELLTRLGPRLGRRYEAPA